MKLGVFTDPHLGVSRKAHTTASSSARLNEALFNQAMACKGKSLPNFIAGDLFDKSHNNERVIAQAIEVATGTTAMAGNHDMSNRADDVTSLQLVAAALPDSIVIAPTISESYWAEPYPGVFAVPHHASQELFLQALLEARDAAERYDGPTYLFVHCNRGMLPAGESAPDSILVIDNETEDDLLQTFATIFYGHEHRPLAEKDDRVIVLGNTHPTGFGDISDKYRYVLDTETGDVEQHLIWSMEDRFLRVKLGGTLLPGATPDFIEVHGVGSRQEVSKYVHEVWDTYPKAFAVRSVCQYEGEVNVADAPVDFHDIPSMIERDLGGTDLLPLMQELREGTV